MTIRPLKIRVIALLLGCISSSASGCSGLLDVQQPTTILDPGAAKTYEGAIAIYGGAITQFTGVFGGAINPLPYNFVSGAFADEFSVGASGGGSQFLDVDQRNIIINGSGSYPVFGDYAALQKGRLLVQQGIGSLQKYAPTAPKSFTGQLFALDGYIEIMLSEGYCSGVPLSSAPFEGDIVYGHPLTTSEILTHAIAQFDSAAVFAADSARVLDLARVGQGRALLDLGRFAEAAASVASVPTSFAYQVNYDQSVANQTGLSDFDNLLGDENVRYLYTVSDREGVNGLNFVSANDPRAPTGTDGVNVFLAKYASGSSPVTLADGIEARLIEAEAALQANDVATWLAKLNDLRATAITPALRRLTAPRTQDARVDLLFRERAFWLFATGHRFGDLRRLVRQYGRAQETVFPTGPYDSRGNFGAGGYGQDVNALIPTSETNFNPYVKGCLDRRA